MQHVVGIRPNQFKVIDKSICMSVAFQIYSRLFNALPAGVRSPKGGIPVLFPCAHMVSDDKPVHVRHLYPFKDIRKFSDDLDHLARHFRPIDIPEIIECLRQGRELPRNSFLYSFDDGFSEMHSVVAPILKRKGLPAIFFLNPDFLDNKKLFYRCKISLIIHRLEAKGTISASRLQVASQLGLPKESTVDDLRKALLGMDQSHDPVLDLIAESLDMSFEDYLSTIKPFLNTDQVNDLVKDGFRIGGHSMDHPVFEKIPLEKQLSQACDSVDMLVKQFNLPYRLFAFPFSDRNISSQFFDRIAGPDPRIELFFGLQYPCIETGRPMMHRFNAEHPDKPVSAQLRYLEAQRSYLKIRGKIGATRPAFAR